MKWYITAVFTLLCSQVTFCNADELKENTVLSAFTSNEIDVLDAVVCPGGVRQCPSGHSCCSVPGNDEVHCCPVGYSCESGVCQETRKDNIAALFPSVGAKIVKCDNQYACPDRSIIIFMILILCLTCIIIVVNAGTCTQGSSSIAMFQKKPAKKRESAASNIVCPDGESECPDDTTCCKLSSGQYGCCPLPKAVCCSDGEHCCPNGYTCDISAGTCSKGTTTLILLQKLPAVQRKSDANSVVCPDGESQCPDGNTCCKLFSGQYGCCPLPKAVCCSDGKHCCPDGYTCDVSAGTCTQGSSSIAMFQKKPAMKRESAESNIVCPDGESECPDDTTCCKLSSGQYGCCPLPKAVCCSDGEHCCPNGYTCDVSAGTCSKGTTSITFLQKLPAVQRKSDANSVVCPDGESQCPDGTTCCKLSTGQYGCCPLPNAVCCSDGEHCCPNGYTCDVSAGSCTQGSSSIPMVQKLPALMREKSASNVVCPDGQSECPDGNTCCKLSSGQYGCCPYPNAVCCSDGEHCCPNGYTCDVSAGTCTQGSSSIPMVQKLPALMREKNGSNVVCPDGQSECPDGNTCCKLSSGQYGCCPYPNAVCCSDGEHCCPNGYTCDVSAGTCTQESSSMPMMQKLPALIRERNASNVVCPGGQSECPDGNTCCKLSSGQYGCCPYPNAVCCSDREHCCPSGYTCDVSAGTCTQGSSSIEMFQKMPAMKRESAASYVVCPDGESECPDGTTCCKLSTGQYGCCPLPNAVCCSDGVHCCPNGYTCDVSAGTCTQGSSSIPMVQKLAALMREKNGSNVVCPDGQSECPDGNTCCKLSSGQYGCCPYPNAVCCSDGEHCCPNGYTCDVSAGTCTQGSSSMPMVQRLPALKREKDASNVVCPGGQSECPDGNTCCRLSSGQYGCCPLPNAVCCSDGKHCCPNGYTCDVSAGTCKQGSSSIASLQMHAALQAVTYIKAVDGVLCPDKKYQCPNGSTCCRVPSGTYGCCPIKNAVCCSDHIHCCPNGYTCDVEGGKCIKNAEHIKMIANVPSSRSSVDTEQKYIKCPDGCSCLDYETCCVLSDGRFGCCPLPHAVCCEDHEHCCPSGYRCDLAAEMCVTGNVRLPMLQKIRSPRKQKTPRVNLEEKIRFVPSRVQDEDPVAEDLLL
ncbi:Granulin [Stylophora pistillata]|uniref:Granulin n=1 Tax=Stylophora pistillata TaxID=50429 RepID=A0A2B4SIQ6_STYPI|nr:Granulin [Stylophora pistillata]